MSEAVRSALARFVIFFDFAEAIAGDEHPLKDSDVIVSVMGGGGSDALRVSDFRTARAALEAHEQEAPSG